MVKRIWDTKSMAQHDAIQLRSAKWLVKVYKTQKGWVTKTYGKRK